MNSITEPEDRTTGEAVAPDVLIQTEPLPVAVRFERRVTTDRWQSVSWHLVEVVPDPGHDVPGMQRGLAIVLHRDEAEGYWMNLGSPEPSIFVAWREGEGADGGPRAVDLTLSYNEAARWMDGGELVDRVALPGELAEWLAEYTRHTYRPEPKRRKRGNKPSFMAKDEFGRMVEAERAAFAPKPDATGPVGE